MRTWTLLWVFATASICAFCQWQPVSASMNKHAGSILPLEITTLKIPNQIDSANRCSGSPLPKDAFSSEILHSNQNSTVLRISIERFSLSAYAEIASVRVDSGNPSLFVFDAPGSKTIILPGASSGVHKISITAMTIAEGGTVGFATDRATCLSFTST